MEHERREGREPRDVSREFLGYDTCRGVGETRDIEVKALATAGSLKLTLHEQQMARRLGNQYGIYVVENALSWTYARQGSRGTPCPSHRRW